MESEKDVEEPALICIQGEWLEDYSMALAPRSIAPRWALEYTVRTRLNVKDVSYGAVSANSKEKASSGRSGIHILRVTMRMSSLTYDPDRELEVNNRRFS